MPRVGIPLLLATALLAAACSGSSSKATPTPTPIPSGSPTAIAATPTPTPPPEEILGVEVRPVTLGAPVPLPDHVAFYIESGCWGCDGPAAALERVYRAPSGELRTEDLFRLPGATNERPEVDGKYITSIATERGGEDILLALCEGPYCGGVGEVQEGAKVSIYHSADGGITWTRETTIEGGAWVRANLGGRLGAGFGILSRVYRPAPGEPWKFEVVNYPGVDQPIELQGQDPAGAIVIFDTAVGPEFLVGADGLTLYHPQGAPANPPSYDFSALPAGSRIVDFQWLPGASGVLVSWTSAAGHVYSGIADTADPRAPAFRAIFRWPVDVQPFFHRPMGGFIDAGRWVVNVRTIGQFAWGDHVPAIVDLGAGTVHPVAEFTERAKTDRVLVKGVSVGPFARVTGAGEGDCLNVREAPSLSATAFACYADGVLLQELGERTEADGHRWAFVSTPGRRLGWASTQYLETSGAAPTLQAHPAGTRTGIAAVDPVIAALERSSMVSQDLIAWRKVECQEPTIEGIGGPPECPPGVSTGTPVDVISGAACEGYWRVRPADGSGVRLALGPGDRLYAVARAAPGDPGAEYVVVYVSGERPEWGKTVYVTGGKVTGDWSGCATTPAAMLEQGGAVVFGPAR
jgi:hypothetical protein